MATHHMKGCATSLIRETQTKTTMRYHFTPIKVAVILKKKKKKLRNVGKDVEKLEPLCIVGRSIKCAATVKNGMIVSEKTKQRITI